MAGLTRRCAALAPLGGLAATQTAAAPQIRHKEANMQIERYEFTPEILGIPRISWTTARGDMVFLSGITATRPGDVADQTRQVLERMDQLMAKAGTSKSKLLTTQVWLTDMSHFGAHNDAWNEWVDHENPPARACLHSPQLWRPGLLVEIMGIAAR